MWAINTHLIGSFSNVGKEFICWVAKNGQISTTFSLFLHLISFMNYYNLWLHMKKGICDFKFQIERLDWRHITLRCSWMFQVIFQPYSQLLFQQIFFFQQILWSDGGIDTKHTDTIILPFKHSLLLLLKEMISLSFSLIFYLVWIIVSESIMGGAKTLEPDLGCDPCHSIYWHLTFTVIPILVMRKLNHREVKQLKNFWLNMKNPEKLSNFVFFSQCGIFYCV